jgi:hypothetical protein
MKLSFLGFVCCLLLAAFAPALQADSIYPYPFEIFTDNGSFADSADLNLYVEVSDAGENRADFTFYNDSLIESCIARIYFDDGTLLGIADITSSPGVSFSLSAKPRNLPGGNMLEPPFVTTVEFSIDSDPPVSKNGINPAEWLRITFDLKNNGLFQDVLDELNNGTLRIGTHIIGLPDGSSESALNGIPEPATIVLFGLGSLTLLRRKRRA